MQGVIETAHNGIGTLKDILALKADCEEKRIYNMGKRVPSAKLLLDQLFQRPVVDAEAVATATHLSPVSVYKLIEDFVKLGILREMTGYKRNRIFVFDEYFTIFKQ